MYSSSLWLCYSGPDCASRVENRFAALDYQVDNLTDIGFRGDMSSIVCIQAPILGKATFCSDGKGFCDVYRMPAKNSTCRTFGEEGFDGTPHSFKPDPADMMCIGFG